MRKETYSKWSTKKKNEKESFLDPRNLAQAVLLFDSIRRYGHLAAGIFPVGKAEDRSEKFIQLSTFELTTDDLIEIPVDALLNNYPEDVKNALDAYKYLLRAYTGTIAFEFEHVNNATEREWLKKRIEIDQHQMHGMSNSKRLEILDQLIEVEQFEDFLQRRFVGQKRFSIEGLDMLVPMLRQLVTLGSEDDIQHMLLGMAHRGRLSVLAHVLEKPLDMIFSEFHKAPEEELIAAENTLDIYEGWSGDVKYHYGSKREYGPVEKRLEITLLANPSHLEYVNPVVLGVTRAAQEFCQKKGNPEQELQKAFNVLIHGDAAFIGEGIVAETLNLSGLEGYKTGGSIHLIANNLLGYTTIEADGRSTRYASDLAKGFEIPIIHVNADDPVACIQAINLAYSYRKTFQKDVLIDLIGYRRYGHNEMDEPRVTQPLLYKEIDEQQNVVHLYSEKLIKDSILSEKELKAKRNTIRADYERVYQNMEESDQGEQQVRPLPKILTDKLKRIDTAIPRAQLEKINEELLKTPKGFEKNRKLELILKRNKKTFTENRGINWALAEVLAYATIIQEGYAIRLTGQDTERGTFAHRHLILHDKQSGKTFCRMDQITDALASFTIHNSPLSEAAVLGFEYGYSIKSAETLVIWEAQFGDFVNVAQVIIDQFIASSRAKWSEISNLVLLLPHGYEGQGPEHSSARLERFLQLAAENNLIVANVTTSAQYFHLIRRQARLGGTGGARPLIVMTPKSLLRSNRMEAEISEFTEGYFEELVVHNEENNSLDKVIRLVIGSGKIILDILKETKDDTELFDWMKLVSVEQLYPFAEDRLKYLIELYPDLEEIVWVQEEPKNMGAWTFVHPYLLNASKRDLHIRYIGRPNRSSPAVGELNVHYSGQKAIIDAAISKDIRSVHL